MFRFINQPMEKTIKILSLFAGIVFLISGIGKSLVSYEFSQIVVQYGFFVWIQYLAPLIIIMEIIIGLLLIFRIWLKYTSLAALCFVVALSLVYFYGYFFVNIIDCGCFGYFSFLNLPPLFTFIRNFILIAIFLFIFIKNNNLNKKADKSEIMIITCILCAVCFVTGYTFVEEKHDFTQYLTEEKHIEDSGLNEFINISEDSTYFVFLFSYSCPHCYNSVENLKQYERLEVADKIIAISYETDSANMKKFNEIFQPNFQIKNYPLKQFFKLTNKFPVSYYIKNNKIKIEIRGLLPTGYLLEKEIQKYQ